MKKSLDELMKKIGYEFKNIRLLETALSHRSYGKKNNERLEFLGDSIVNFIIANELFKRFPKTREGDLSRLRSKLVKGETLARLAKEFEIGEVLRLGQGEIKSGGAKRTSILADAVEAIIAAIYVDAGMEICCKRVRAWYKKRLDVLSPDNIQKDPKSELQELLQSKQLPLPKYKLIGAKGEEHEQIFVIECKISLLDEAIRGEGKSRRAAEQKVAEAILKELDHEE